MKSTLRTILQVAAIGLITATSAWATTATQRQVYNEVLQEDIEPTVIAQNRSGVIYTTTVFMKFFNTINDVNSQFYYSSFNSAGATRANPLSLPSGYVRAADPVLAQNLTTSNGANRIWLGGVLVDSSGGTRLAVWCSDDGGFTWSAPSTMTTGDTPDKPAIAVSADPSSPGYVYLTYVDTTTSAFQVKMMVSPDGGASWQGPYTVSPASQGNEAPQVMVDSTTGTVYTLWVHPAASAQIQLASAARWTSAWNLNLNANFTSLTALTTGPQYGGYYGPTLNLGAVALRNQTCPIAKMDSANGRFSVVWHELVLGTPVTLSPTMMAAYTFNTTPHWSSPIQVSTNSVGHSVKPAMDVDTSGNYMVTFYYFPGNAPTYEQHAVYTDAFGTRITPEIKIGPCYTSPCGSDLFDVSVYAADLTESPLTYWRHLGEYQDVSYVSGKWYSAAIGVVTCPNSYVTCHGNPFVWTITQP